MKIKSVEAHGMHIPIPPERQHVSDFGKGLSFDGTIVRIEAECGITVREDFLQEHAVKS